MASTIIPVSSLDPVEHIPDPGTGPAVPPPGKRPRIEEVARLAGVSIISVSRALRKPEIVSKETRARIEEAVAATGFSLNPHASALRSGRSNVVMVFISSLYSEQFVNAAHAFSEVMEPAGFEVVLARTFYNYQREIQLTSSLTQVRPAAVFITGVLEQERNRAMFERMNIPVVESWAYTDQPIDMLVGMSNTDGAIAVARHLYEKGYRRLGFIGRQTGRGRIRRLAFEAECARLGAQFVGDVSLPTVKSWEEGAGALGQLLDSGADPDAVFCANDLMACGALMEARSRGLRVPEDLALMGFGDNSLMRELPPGISTVTCDPFEIGRRAAEMLVSRLSGTRPAEERIVLPLSLIERGSA